MSIIEYNSNERRWKIVHCILYAEKGGEVIRQYIVKMRFVINDLMIGRTIYQINKSQRQF